MATHSSPRQIYLPGWKGLRRGLPFPGGGGAPGWLSPEEFPVTQQPMRGPRRPLSLTTCLPPATLSASRPTVDTPFPPGTQCLLIQIHHRKQGSGGLSVEPMGELSFTEEL